MRSDGPKARREVMGKKELDLLAPVVLRALFELIKKGRELSITNIADKVNENYGKADRLRCLTVDWILTALGISRIRNPRLGTFIVNEQESKQVLESLRRQYHL